MVPLPLGVPVHGVSFARIYRGRFSLSSAARCGWWAYPFSYRAHTYTAFPFKNVSIALSWEESTDVIVRFGPGGLFLVRKISLKYSSLTWSGALCVTFCSTLASVDNTYFAGVRSACGSMSLAIFPFAEATTDATVVRSLVFIFA